MSLRARLVLLFSLAALVPFGALGLVVQKTFVEELEADHARQLEQRTGSAGRRLDDVLDADARAVRALCQHEPVVDRLLLDLAAQRFDASRQQALVSALPPLMRGRRFDTLHLLDARSGDDRGRVLAAGHYPDRAGARDGQLLDALARHGGAPWIETVRVLPADEGAPRDVRVLITGCTTQRDGVSLAVLGGRLLDDDLVATSGDGGPVRLAWVGPGDATPPTDREPPRQVRAFPMGTSDDTLRLIATLDDAPLRDDLDRLRARSVYVAGGGLLVALVLALLVAWMLSRPLRALEEATRRVAKGDLDSEIETGRARDGDDVGRTLRAFNDMTRELAATRRKLLRAERIAAWREVARRIAHEIKNPLQPIQMEIETMRKLHARGHPSFDEEFQQSTGVILEEVKRLNDMVTEFSRFARMPRPRPVRLDLRDVVQHVVGLHTDEAVQLTVRADAPVEVRADRDQLTQVLLNLVQNATDAATARHGGTGGHVEVHLEPTPEGALLRVLDDGPGIPLEERLRVFEPYFTTKAHGTGLGLAIVHRIVGDHGGSVDVEDGLDGGAAFVVTLPAEGPAPDEPSASLSDTALPLSRAKAKSTSRNGP